MAKDIKLYHVVLTVEFELELGLEDIAQFRLEVLTEDEKEYLGRLYKKEHIRIQSTFPQDDQGKPDHKPSDEEIWVDHSWYFNQERIQAVTANEALEIFLTDLRSKLEN